MLRVIPYHLLLQQCENCVVRSLQGLARRSVEHVWPVYTWGRREEGRGGEEKRCEEKVTHQSTTTGKLGIISEARKDLFESADGLWTSDSLYFKSVE